MVVACNGNLYGLDKDTGQAVWRDSLEGRWFSHITLGCESTGHFTDHNHDTLVQYIAHIRRARVLRFIPIIQLLK